MVCKFLYQDLNPGHSLPLLWACNQHYSIEARPLVLLRLPSSNCKQREWLLTLKKWPSHCEHWQWHFKLGMFCGREASECYPVPASSSSAAEAVAHLMSGGLHRLPRPTLAAQEVVTGT